MNIAFIVLGNMGAPMARNLIKAGHSLQLFDLNKAVLAEFAELGAQISDSPRQAAEGSALVITMLPAAAHVRSVYLNDDGVLKGIAPGTPAVDCSPIDPQTIRDIAAVAAQQGVVLGDAPVSGGTGGAQAGTLTFMVGRSPEHLQRSSQCWNRWAETSCIAVKSEPVRSPRSATTCCWRFR